MDVVLRGQAFSFLPERALYKYNESLLIIADVHLGKASHFRKQGIPIPAASQAGDYTNLQNLINKKQPQKVYFLGDLFHSYVNSDWYAFEELIRLHPGIEFTLIKGNHDIVDYRLFDQLGVTVCDGDIIDGPFIYSHKPLDAVPDGSLNIAGHIHPGILLQGLAKQSIKLPCFHLSTQHLILPAFGILTGLYTMEMSKHNKVYAVLPNEVRVLN